MALAEDVLKIVEGHRGEPAYASAVMTAHQVLATCIGTSGTQRITRRPPMQPIPPRFTDAQGQYLAFIAAYVKLHRQAPAEADFVTFFRVTPPTVHRMIVTLTDRGLIHRDPRRPRSIRLLVDVTLLPPLQ